MLRFYPLIIIIQAFCVYHAYTNRSEQKWFWVIIFFPFIGCLIYLYHHFYSRRNYENIKEGIKGTLIKNYTLDKLEEKVRFSDTFANKLELAKEHINVGNNDRAIEILNSCSKNHFEDDPTLNTHLLHVHYLNEDYEKAVKYGNTLEGNREFQKSNEIVAYAWANYKTGNIEKAKSIFEKLDTRYSNYPQRLEYVYFLIEYQGNEAAEEVLNELMVEINSMDSYERKINKQIIGKIKYLNREIYND